MMVDILCAGLTNSIYSKDILPMYSSDITKRREISHFFMVIDINSFLDSKIFKSTLQTIANRIRKLERLGNEPVMIPGDPEKHTKKIRIKNGIPIDSEKFEEFLKINISFKRCIIE
jgi:LDH2 family malate/lactate/ureidoglycolate dehydrogenase